MNFQVVKPSYHLTPFVKQYWTMESQLSSGKSFRQRIVPTGLVEWTFYLEDLPTYLRGRGSQKSLSIISGQQNGYFDISISGRLLLFSVVFTPYGSKYFLNMPTQELTDLSIPSEFILKGKSAEIAAALYDAKCTKQRVALVECFLFERIFKKEQTDLRRLLSTFQIINCSGGIASIDHLTSDACLSRKQFERVFTDNVGIPPKRYLRIIRFQNLLYTRQLTPGKTLTSLALDCGYYDQSHMINDFKSLTGITPRQYLADCTPYSDYFSNPTQTTQINN